MNDAERLELEAHQKELALLRARVDYSIQRGRERLATMLRGESLSANPVELSAQEWDAVRDGCDAWDEVLSARRA